MEGSRAGFSGDPDDGAQLNSPQFCSLIFPTLWPHRKRVGLLRRSRSLTTRRLSKEPSLPMLTREEDIDAHALRRVESRDVVYDGPDLSVAS